MSMKFGILIGLDIGVWLLVVVGLLIGYKVMIYWDEFICFLEMFLEVEVCEDWYVLILGLVICGGVLIVIELLLELIKCVYMLMFVLEVVVFFMYGDKFDLYDFI